MRWPIALIVAACGGATPAALPPEPPVVAAKPAPVTCADAAVILRGEVNDLKHAGPAKDGVIATVCKTGAWPAELLACVGTSPAARGCLEKLSAEQRAAYDAALIAWNDQFPDETLDEPPMDGDLDDEVDCFHALLDPASFAPAVPPMSDDHTFHVELRRQAIETQCEGWTMPQRACFRDASGPGIQTCRTQLTNAQAQALTSAIASVDQRVATFVSLKKTPAAIECKKVAAAYYADALWSSTLPALRGPELKRAIAESRALLTKACTREAWTPTLRACLVAEANACVMDEQVKPWPYPAAGVYVKTGISECDTYSKHVQSLSKCKLPETRRLEQSNSSLQRVILTMTTATAEWRQQMGGQCSRLDAELRELAANSKCKL